jgi:hypothetical protein
VGKDESTVVYNYTCEEDSHFEGNASDRKIKWCFVITIENDVFQFDLVDESDFMRVEMMNRNDCERYKARGITEEFIRLGYQLFNLPICSSARLRPQNGPNGIKLVAEQHSDDAAKVWKRLVNRGEAFFDEKMGRYVYPVPNTLSPTGTGPSGANAGRS